VTDSDTVRASDADREAVVERLRVASAEGRLTLEELTTRTESAYAAQTAGELAGITADLPARASNSVATTGHRTMVSVFGNVARAGYWRAEATVTPVSVFGDVELDLRQAIVPSGEVAIVAVAPFGDIEVVVPDGVNVELSGFSLFGRKKTDVRPAASATNLPTVRVRAATVFGSVVVRS
jgi:Domain of unknown function (DUF1707)/Cell wall-active antibiotics response 4TMS YvqF